tara:strand:+ start:29962 stop:30537 length:576 start_codon:yes stop_codon:yes gene_type:complete
MSHRKHREDSKDDWRTPPELFARLNSRFRFTGDACANPKNALCARFFTYKSNALANSWSSLGDRVFINPPYSKSAEFMSRAWHAARDGEVKEVVALMPSTVDVKWFHKYVVGKASELWFMKGRVGFLNPSTGKPVGGNVVGSMIIVWSESSCRMTGTRLGSFCSRSFQPIGSVDKAYWVAASESNLMDLIT